MEAGMQQATPEHGQETQASAEGSCRLEIERLHKIIQDYAQICLHSSREIEQLRNKLQQCTLDLHAKPSEGNVQNEGTIPVDIALRHNLRLSRERNVELATEVERLRLTPEEREAIAVCAQAAANCGGFGEGPAIHQGDKVAATLNGLLERLN
jgi:hypothetical protein